MIRCLASSFLAVAPLILLNATSGVAEEVKVVLDSGRGFAGSLHSGTDRDRLHLQSGGESLRIVRPIRWDRIESLTLDGQPTTIQQLLQRSAELKTTAPPARHWPRSPESESSRPAARVRVASVDFDVSLRNWDADIALDGLAVRVLPYARDGRLVEAAGNVEVTLYAPRYRRFHEAPTSAGWRVDRIGHWRKPVAARQIDEDVYLPFTNVRPDRDRDIQRYGLVHLKYVAPGHGVFERVYDGVQLQPFRPVEDGAYLHRQRGLPSELP